MSSNISGLAVKCYYINYLYHKGTLAARNVLDYTEWFLKGGAKAFLLNNSLYFKIISGQFSEKSWFVLSNANWQHAWYNILKIR